MRLDSSAAMLPKLGARPLVLCAGPLAPGRGQHLVLQAFHVLKTYLSLDACLALAGDPVDTGYSRALERLVAELALADVFFMGQLADREWDALYRRADVLIDMARTGAGSHLTEALGFGIPIITCGAEREMVGSAGLVIDGLEPVLAAEALALILSDSTVKRRLQAASHERGQELAGWRAATRIVKGRP